MRTRIWLLLLMGGFPMLGFSQTELNFSGKVTDMQGFFRQNQHYTFNQFQQRFELEAHLLPSVQVHLGLRNRILSGPLLRKNPTYATLFEYDSGLLDLTKMHSVVFHKVKGHADNAHNNRCDALARNAIRENQKRKES